MKNEELFPVLILAGGFAKRLQPLSQSTPKSLIPICGEPFIAHQLRLLRKNKIKRVILCIGHLGEKIMDFVGDGKQFDLHITYSNDGPEHLGTAGAIKQIASSLSEPFFVLYGDSYLTCDYLAVQNHFKQAQKKALMTVYYNNGQWDTSNVEFKDQQILDYSKTTRTDRMHYIDYGLGLFHPSAFNNLPLKTMYDLAFLYQTLLKNNELIAYEVKERFYEIGSFSGIKELGEILWNSSNNI